MVGSALTLALIGLGAVSSALPTGDSSVKERQTFGLGPGGSSFGSGSGQGVATCNPDVPLNEQPPCIITVISGGLKPPKDKRFTSAPPGTGSTFHPRKRSEQLGAYADSCPHPEDLDAVELAYESFLHKDRLSFQETIIKEKLKSVLLGCGITIIKSPDGTSTTIKPSDKRNNACPYAKDLDSLELAYESLLHKDYLSPGEKASKEFLAKKLLACGITIVKSPDGTSTTIKPSDKRNNACPYAKDLDSLELAYESLLHKDYLSPGEKASKEFLAKKLLACGITIVKSPDGTSTTIKPSDKRNACPYSADLDKLELAYESLLHKDHLSHDEKASKDFLAKKLLACGITIVKSPDGTSTTIKPSDKRDVFTPDFDLVGLEKAYEELLQSVGNSKPSFATWLALEHMASVLKLYGITIEQSPAGTTTTLRPGKMARRQTFTIGKQTCELSDINSLKVALATLLAAYGDPRQAPQNIFLIEQVIVSYLTVCGQTVNGWTTLTPGNPIPGGPITPDPTTPGAPIKPDPTHPGGAITPDPTVPGGSIHPSDRRQAPVSDPAALLAALQLLESKYGTYGSGTIPVPIFLIMENMVTILQDIPGVIVPGWPILGAGSTGQIRPSN